MTSIEHPISTETASQVETASSQRLLIRRMKLGVLSAGLAVCVAGAAHELNKPAPEPEIIHPAEPVVEQHNPGESRLIAGGVLCAFGLANVIGSKE